MTKRVFLLIIISLLTVGVSFAQKSQKIAYIDMEYILENVPEYQEANQQLEIKVKRWQNKIAKQQKEIELLKTNLDNERALLTANLIKEREEDIEVRVEELTKIQDMYFGVKGDLYRLRKQLVKPVQDQIYNAIQEIAKKNKYDFVLDKSSDLIMLYTNNRFDISDRVVNSITRTEKKKELKSKREKKQKEIEEKQEAAKEVNPEIAKKAEDREARRKELQERIAAQKAERLKKREEQLKAIEEARQKRIEERQAAKNKTTENKKEEQKTQEEPVETEEKTVEKEAVQKPKETVEEKKEEILKETPVVEEKSEENKEVETQEETPVEEVMETPEKTEKDKLREKIEEQKAARLKQREERLKEIEEARIKRLKEREEAKKKLDEQREAARNKVIDSIPVQEPENNDPE